MQTQLSKLSIDLAQLLSDGVNDAGVIITDYTIDGQRLTADQRITAINYAREVVFLKYYSTLKDPVLFLKLFPEYLGIESLNIDDIPDKVMYVLNFTAYNLIYYPIDPSFYAESVSNIYSPYYYGKGNFFVFSGKQIIPTKEIIPSGAPVDTFKCVYIKAPIPFTIDTDPNADDIPDRNLYSEILQESFKKAIEMLNYQ